MATLHKEQLKLKLRITFKECELPIAYREVTICTNNIAKAEEIVCNHVFNNPIKHGIISGNIQSVTVDAVRRTYQNIITL